MLNFSFWSPTRFEFGRDAAAKTGALARQFGGHKVLLHYGGGSVKRNGCFDAVTKSLAAAGVEYLELGGVAPNPRSGLIYRGIELCRAEGVDMVLALGGGSAIDSAKAIAAGVCYAGDFWDLIGGAAPITAALPVGVVLTIAAAGSEGSYSMVITKEEGMLKRGAKSDLIRPKFSVLDPCYTFTLPPYQTACGITDMLAHICERYFSHTPEVELTDRLCEAVLKAVIDAAPKALANPQDYEARATLMWAGTLAHNNLLGVGREQDWGSHKLEHELSALYDCAHGAGLAVILPAWMQYALQGNERRFAQFAVRVWGCEMDFAHPERTAAQGVARLRAFLKSLGMPLTFRELGAKVEDIPLLVKTMGCTEQAPLGNFVKLTPAVATAIYHLAL